LGGRRGEAAIDDILNGVSCASGSACMAVGSRERETLIETGR
jgi:hypothetical protein